MVLKNGADLANLAQLDQKLWVALACPTTGLSLDERFLKLLDTDNDKRIRAPELIAGVKFASGVLKNLDDLFKGEESLPLTAINGETPAGQLLLRAARQVLRNLGKEDANAIAVADLEDPTRIFADTPFNGDGAVTELSTSDAELKAVIAEIVDCLGPDPDRSGKPGVSATKLDAFFAEVEKAHVWHKEAEANAAVVLPLGENTAAAVATFEALRVKVDDYFARCKLAAFDPRVVGMLNRAESEYVEIVSKNLSINGVEAAHFPLAQVWAGRPLPLVGAVNPAYAAALKKLNELVVTPLLGFRNELGEFEWHQIGERLEGHLAWLRAKAGPVADKLSAARLAVLVNSGHKAALLELIEKDKALESEAQSLQDVERLVRYYRSLYALCTNFVNFRDFYDPARIATFQYGTLYLDQRTCSLCMRVDEPAKHAALAGLAGAYLAYVDCMRPGTGEKMQIVVIITDGDSDNLMVGRNGLFYDRQGRDWDATITKIIDNPISLRQAFFSPYKKLVRLIEEQVAKRASAADADANAKLGAAAEGVSKVDQAKPADPKKPVDVGAVAALGVAVAGIGTFFTAVLGYASGIIQMGFIPTLAALIGLILLISLPSVVLAYVKLRKRNLGPLLDASGWAINSQAKVNVPFGTTLTNLAKVPPGSRAVADAYADRGLPWKRWVFLALVLYLTYQWFNGSFDRFLPEQLESRRVTEILPQKPAQAPVAPAAAPAP